jgi:hypothetical protein
MHLLHLFNPLLRHLLPELIDQDQLVVGVAPKSCELYQVNILRTQVGFLPKEGSQIVKLGALAKIRVVIVVVAKKNDALRTY